MPQKRNPVTAERISGLAKVARSLVLVALENIPLWHERDLTNSSSERLAIPHAFLVVDEMLDSTISLLENLVVKPESMKRNLELTRGAVMAEAVMVELVRRGVARHEAHEILRSVERKASAEGASFKEMLLKDPRVAKHLSPEDVERLLKPENYLGAYSELIDRALRYVEDAVRSAGLEPAG
jgi:adenylosuccinate lyase